MFLPCDSQQRIVAVKTENLPFETDHSCDTNGNGPRTTAYVENGHTWSKEIGQTPMVTL